MAKKKVRKTEKFLNSSKLKSHNSCKNESMTLKRKLDLQLFTKKQYLNQVSIFNLQRWQKKVWKTEKFLNSSKFQGHNSCKNESITLKHELEL
jgi:hypothetical protein